MTPYERLTAWKLAHKLALETYRITTGFPPSERFGLTNQLRRAAFSVAANIAEGSAKRGKAEFRRYLDISLGSLAELQYTLLLCKDLELLAIDDWQKIETIRDEAGKLIWGLYRAMQRPAGESRAP